jgi:hypothetical protein
LKFNPQEAPGPLILSARGFPTFASPIPWSDVFEVLDAEIYRRSALQANAIGPAILGERESRVMTLRMTAAEDEIYELLEHALGS